MNDKLQLLGSLPRPRVGVLQCSVMDNTQPCDDRRWVYM